MGGKRIAIVTGASSGMGRACLLELDRRQEAEAFWVIARGAEGLEKLDGQTSRPLVPIPLDLTCRESFAVLEQRLAQERPDIRWLVNSAGFAKFCAYSDLSTAETLNMIDLNVSAVAAMGLLCLPYMAQGAHIVNIASQAAFQPLPYLNVYSATKAFVRNYTRALHVELQARGITATAVCPGWMDTALFQRGEIGAAKGPTVFRGMAQPSAVARKAIADAAAGRDISVYSLYVKLAHAAAKLTPQRLMMRLWLAQQGLRP